MIDNNLNNAKSKLNGDTSLVLVKDNDVIVLNGRGISPVLKLIETNRNYSGYSLADTVVGKAVATMFVKLGIERVYARLISQTAFNYLKEHNIDVQYDSIVTNILNRDKTDLCPMEKAVQNINEPEEAYIVLKDRYEQMIKSLKLS